MQQYIAYRRVSTQRQGVSGLGLDAQNTAIKNFVKDNPIIAEFTEIETGKKAARPQLQKAIELCKQTGATLVVGKLDRLARNVEFTSALMNSGVQFVACDMPFANRLSIHILAAVAEDEARRISERTKAALAEAKKRGKLLGAANPKIKQALAGKQGKYERGPSTVPEKYHAELSAIHALQTAGKSYRQIAQYLNEAGKRTSKGKQFSSWTIHHILKHA